MMIKKVIEKLRGKGYDDLYLADLANKWDTSVFLFLFIIQFMLVMFICVSPFMIMGEDWTKHELFAAVMITWMGTGVVIFLLSWVCDATIKGSKEKGETDLRLSYMFGSAISKLSLKAMRFAPIASAVFLVISYVASLIIEGYNLASLAAMGISGVLIFLTSYFYHKILSKLGNEATYYVDWKTNQIADNYEELLSRHEKWWIPSASLDFEKFNINKYRSIQMAAFVGTFACLLTGFVYSLGFSPLIGIYTNEIVSPHTEQIIRRESNTTHEESISTLHNNSTSPEAEMSVDENEIPVVEENEIPVVEENEIPVEPTSKPIQIQAQGRVKAYISTEREQNPDDYVNVRKEASTKSAVVRRLDVGTGVYVSPTTGNWYKVSLSAKGPYLGYVYWDRVDEWGTFENPYESTFDFVVTDPDGYTNVRLSATTQSPIVRKLDKGTHFLGKPCPDAPNWIGVFMDSKLIGFVYHTKVKKVQTVYP